MPGAYEMVKNQVVSSYMKNVSIYPKDGGKPSEFYIGVDDMLRVVLEESFGLLVEWIGGGREWKWRSQLGGLLAELWQG